MNYEKLYSFIHALGVLVLLCFVNTTKGQYFGPSSYYVQQQPAYQTRSTTVARNGYGQTQAQSTYVQSGPMGERETMVRRTNGPMGQQTTVVRENTNPQYYPYTMGTGGYGAVVPYQQYPQGGIYKRK